MTRVEEVFKDFAKENKFTVNKELGKGSYGSVKEITYNNKVYAAKLIKKDANDIHNESSLILEFRGPGIVKVNKIFTKEYSDKEAYRLIVMEKASLKNLFKFHEGIYKKNLLNLIFKNPFDLIGENLLRFFTIQLMKGLELLNRTGYSHFDIKPGNIIIFKYGCKIYRFWFFKKSRKIRKE